MLKPHMCACIHTHTQNSRKEPATKTGMQGVIALVEVQTFHRCLIVHMGQASLKMNTRYIKCTLSLFRLSFVYLIL